MNGEVTWEIKKDFGSFGDGKWQYHLTLLSFNGGEARYDIRPWSEDMTKMGKGIRLDNADLYDLLGLIEDVLENGQ